MRSYNTPSERCHTRTKHDSPPPRLLHSRQAQLCQQESGPAVGAPGALEIVDANVTDGSDVRFAERETGVVEKDGGGAQSAVNGGVEAADLR